jgi:hypothetical protein
MEPERGICVLHAMGQVITFDDPRRDRLRFKLLGFARTFQPVVIETSTGLHPCTRIICHDRFVELVTELGEKEPFRFDQSIDATPMMPLEQMAAKANFQVVEEEPKSGSVIAFKGRGVRAKPSTLQVSYP